MAYAAVSVALGARAQASSHSGGGSGGSAPAGDVYVAWDTVKVTTISQLKQALVRAVEIAAQGYLKDT